MAIVHERADGAVAWQRTLKVQGANLAVDPRNGDIVAAGLFTGPVDFGGSVVTSQPDDLSNVYIARYTKDNALVRVDAYHGANTQSWANPTAVAVGPAGEVVLAGYMVGTFDFGTAQPAKSANQPGDGRRDLFLASWSASGAPRWAKNSSPGASDGRSADAGVSSIAVDAAGNVGVAGFYKGTMNLGGGTFTSTLECIAPDHVAQCAQRSPSQRKYSYDILMAEFTAAGAHIWSKAFGSPAEDRAYVVAFEPNGVLVAAGLFAGTVDFGGGPLTNRFHEQQGPYDYGASWESDIFLVQYSSAGAHQWSKHFVPSDFAFVSGMPQALTVAPNGDLVLGGSISRDVDFGGGPLPWSGEAPNDDAFVARFAATGAHKWSRRFGTWLFEDRTKGLVVHGGGEITAVGSWSQQIGPRTQGRDPRGHLRRPFGTVS